VAGEVGRWVCTNCFASNDATATVCAQCGVARDPAVSAAATWTESAAPAGGEPKQRQFPLRFVMFGVIVLVVVGAGFFFAARRGDTGEITDAGDLSVFDLRVGDCFDVPSDTDATEELGTVKAIPCDEPHVYELFWSGDYPASELPPESESDPWLEEQCIPAFEEYVGIDFDVSIYYVSVLTPTSESWADGDRVYQCYLHNEGETPMSGSARGAAQ
jgi:hypothetical protein